MRQNALVLVAGGVGERANRSIPKQFVEIHRKPVLIHTLEKFIEYDKDIISVIVCHPQYIDYCCEIKKRFLGNYEISIITGGKTRFHSVKNGLNFLRSIDFNGIVAVHDAARPCINTKLIARCFDTAYQFGNAIPAIPISETIREIKGENSIVADRNKYVIIQTPQCAQFPTIFQAFQQDYQPIFTDEANVLEYYGEKIKIVEGEKNNIKITYPFDFELASLILQSNLYE